MTLERALVVNADDFGLSAAVNRGVIAAHEHGIVTSASLMVRRGAARDAVARALAWPRLGLGLHLDLGEWAFGDAGWTTVEHVVDLDDPVAVAAEIAAQVADFRALVGRPPDHLDSHQHVHLHPPVDAAAVDAARRLGVPLRGMGPIRFCGDFHGQTATGEPVAGGIAPQRLIELIGTLAPGATELSCHPAHGPQPDSPYDGERRQELATLCDVRVRAVIAAAGVRLCSFAEL